MMRMVPSGEMATNALTSTTGAAGLAGVAASVGAPSVVSAGVTQPERRRPPPAAEASRKKRREVLMVLPSAMVQTSRVSLVSTPAAVLMASRMRT